MSCTVLDAPRSQHIKAGLNMDGIGWADVNNNPTNEIWFTDGESARLAQMFDAVRSMYGINIGYTTTYGVGGYGSDQSSYWSRGIEPPTAPGDGGRRTRIPRL